MKISCPYCPFVAENEAPADLYASVEGHMKETSHRFAFTKGEEAILFPYFQMGDTFPDDPPEAQELPKLELQGVREYAEEMPVEIREHEGRLVISAPPS